MIRTHDDRSIIGYTTVKTVFRGHCDERTPSDQCPIYQMLNNLQLNDTCHVGTLSLGY